MRTPRFVSQPLSEPIYQGIETRFENALRYFRERSPVVFFSYCRFWEKHAFVQQSLAKALVENGIEVIWLDGAGWRPYEPTHYFDSPRLQVSQLFQLPGRRVPVVDRLNIKLQIQRLKTLLKPRRGKRPLFWVQAGIDERLAAELPYVDIYSVFDDPYRHTLSGSLCQKAELILCQNSLASRWLGATPKVKLALPPVDLSRDVFGGDSGIPLPPGFPQRIMGYIGSFFSAGFDLDLFESFLKTLPDWGFLLMGRTDEAGMKYLNRFRKYPNFFHLAWMPRACVASAWKLLDVTLLLYRPCREQDGAFATKVLESSYFGVPCVATRVPKTEELEGFFPRAETGEKLVPLAIETSQMSETRLREIYSHFAVEMHPKLHLARVAEALSGLQKKVVLVR